MRRTFSSWLRLGYQFEIGTALVRGRRADPVSGGREVFHGDPVAYPAHGGIAGRARHAGRDPVPLAQDRDMMVDLGTPTGAQSVAHGINDAGEIVGWVTAPGGPSRAFLARGGRLRDLGTLGFYASQASAINNAGQVVGSVETAEGGGMRSFPTVRG